ncbi:MAG: hypothetical protein ACLGHX_10050 [Acidimicrobiia bacterium]
MTTSLSTEVRPDAAAAARGARVALWGTVAGAVLGVGYFTVGGIFAPLSDLAAGVIGVGLMPVVLHLHRRGGRSGVDGVAATGLAAAAGMITSSLGLIVSDTLQIEGGRAFLTVQFLSMAAFGGWLLATVRREGGRFSRRWHTTALVTAVAYVVAGIGEPLTGFRQIVIYSAGSVAVVAFCLWAARTRRELMEDVRTDGVRRKGEKR